MRAPGQQGQAQQPTADLVSINHVIHYFGDSFIRWRPAKREQKGLNDKKFIRPKEWGS
jgi:hypothetical protein